jgi:hypothetical protein
MLPVRCLDLVSSHATQADCTRGEHLFSKTLITTNTLQLTRLPATQPYTSEVPAQWTSPISSALRCHYDFKCTRHVFGSSLHTSRKTQTNTFILRITWQSIHTFCMHTEHMFLPPIFTKHKKKKFLVSSPRPSVRLGWLSATKPSVEFSWKARTAVV